ncbi:hypothetical protein [Embleya sp. AB8]|uniref:hypothetical protein n=1 Tax=Embleya sp. AB8 TaxID=3156304 RepID=UPI003C78E737
MIPGSEWTCAIDEVAVALILAGTVPRPELTEREQRYAARLMTEERRSAKSIAKAVGVSAKTIERWLVAGRGAS